MLSIRLSSLLMACLIVSACGPTKGQVVVINRSDNETTNGTLLVGGREFNIAALKPGESQGFSFNITNDSHYEISVTPASGQKLERDIGYVTHGLEAHDTLVIMKDGISSISSTAGDGN